MKKLSDKTKTVLVLVVLMLASGLIVPQAYKKFADSQEFRPPFEKGLTKNIQLLDDKRGVISLSEFQGGIWVTYCTSSQENGANMLIHNKVSALRETFPDHQIKACIFLADATEKEADKLKAYRAAHADILTDDDYIVSANIPVVQKYIKNEFRFSDLPYEKDGVWIYDTDLILLDQIPKEEGKPQAVLCHMRGHFNFTRAQELDQEAMKEGKVVQYESKINKLLLDSVQYLIDNPNEEDAALKGAQ